MLALFFCAFSVGPVYWGVRETALNRSCRDDAWGQPSPCWTAWCAGAVDGSFSSLSNGDAVSQGLPTGDSSSAQPFSSRDMPIPTPVPPDPSRPPTGASFDSRGQTVAGDELSPQSEPPKQNVPRESRSLPPPPPPPRAQPASVRPMPEIQPTRSGIGSATTRWRGDLPLIDTNPQRGEEASEPDVEPGDPSEIAGTENDDDQQSVEEVVGRSAPPWLLSLVVHLILLLILALISTPAGRGISSLVLEMGIGEASDDEPVAFDTLTIESDFDEPQELAEDALIETEIPDIFEPVEVAEQVLLEPDLLGDQSIDIGRPMFGGRTGAMKKALMALYGATDETQEAVQLGLAWLKRQQHRNGHWSLAQPYSNGAMSENKIAATAMAILAFAGDGNTHLSGPYQQEVEKGVKFLVGQQNRGGFMASSVRGNPQTYAQAQASIALCELYAMTGDSWLRAYAQRSIDYAMKAQAANGGWRYRPMEPGDTSVTGWYVMAIQSAMAAGLEVDDSKVRQISKYLDSASVYEGAGYSYQPGAYSPTATMTAEGLLCRQYLGWEREHRSMLEGIAILQEQEPFSVKNQNVYYWYYATQVFHHFGGSPWRIWNSKMSVDLPRIQIKDGKERGSWAPQRDRWGAHGGRLYTTCLSIYCLEVYYRHLPLYEQELD